jgi:hypothetical protein
MDSIRLRSLAIGVFCFSTLFAGRVAYAAPANACSLLTPDQVSAVLGVTVGEGKSVVPKVCQWSVSGQSKKVLLTLLDERAFAYAKMPVGHGITKTPVGGIGDEALYGTTPRVATTLSVRKGKSAFTVRVAGFDETKDIDQIKEKEKTLAEEILSKM